MPAVGLAVAEDSRVAARELIGDFLFHYGRTQRRIAARDCFGHGHNIRHNAPMLHAEHTAGAAEPADHFVGD